MAPTKKEKTEKVTGDEGEVMNPESSFGQAARMLRHLVDATLTIDCREIASDVILKYLRKQNRPYSATDVSANLHNKVTKVAAQKILKQLFEKNEIEERASGKQLVYHALQDTSAAPTTDDLTTMTEETTSIQTETNELRARLRLLKSKLTGLNTSRRLTMEELCESIVDLEHERQDLLARLEPLRSGSATPVTTEERVAIATEHLKWTKVAKKRKQIRDEMWAQIQDGAGDNAGDLRETLGIA